MTTNKIVGISVTFLVLLTVTTALYILDSPSAQRNLRLDQIRTNDLRSISTAIGEHRDKREKLPIRLEDLVNGQFLERLPTDPETKEHYSYQLFNDNTYKLCADFFGKSNNLELSDFWYHESGIQCFEFEF